MQKIIPNKMSSNVTVHCDGKGVVERIKVCPKTRLPLLAARLVETLNNTRPIKQQGVMRNGCVKNHIV